MASRQLTETDVYGTDLHPNHNPKAFALLNELAAIADGAAAPTVTKFGASGFGLAATNGDALSRTHTGTLTADELVFDITKECAGRAVTSIDVLATIACSGTAATGNLTTATVANTVDDEYFTLPNAKLISDTLTAVNFFYDKTGGSVTPVDATHIKIDISADTTAAEVAARTRTAINATTGILWTFAAPVGAQITGTYNSVGVDGNGTWTENVAHASFLVTSSTGGIDATLADFSVAIEELSVGVRTELSACVGEEDYDAPGTNKVVTFTPAAYDVPLGGTILLAIDLDLRKTGDSVIIKEVTLNFA